MKALITHGDGKVALERIAIPTPGPEDVLVKVHGCTICGSDVKLIDGQMSGIDFPLVPGHEWSGTVIETPQRLRPLLGRRVVADILQACGRCEPCIRGQHNLCTSLIEPGLTAQGGFAEFIAVPVESLHFLPDALTLDLACLVEPLSVVLYALSVQPPHVNDRILVIGGGGIGLLVLAALRARGCEVVALVDPHEARRDCARQFGAVAAGRSWTEDRALVEAALRGPADLVYNASSRAQGFHDALDACRPGGRICLIGYSGSQKISLEPSTLVVKLLDIRGALSPTYDWMSAIALLAEGKITAGALLTHGVDFPHFTQGLAWARERSEGAIRVMVKP